MSGPPPSVQVGEGATPREQQTHQDSTQPPRSQQPAAGPSGRAQPGQRQGHSSSRAPRQCAASLAADDAWLSDSSSGDDEQRGGDHPHQQQSPDPLYDDQADERDMAWAITARQGRTSDAILSCPGCFATLCIDCQQHHLYSTQFRAMFVMNCETRAADAFTAGDAGRGSGGRKRRHGATAPGEEQQGQGDACYPVHCATCGTRVGAMDSDEVYHFTSVLVSTA